MTAPIVTNNTRQALWLAPGVTPSPFDGDVMADTKAETPGQLWERVAETSRVDGALWRGQPARVKWALEHSYALRLERARWLNHPNM